MSKHIEAFINGLKEGETQGGASGTEDAVFSNGFHAALDLVLQYVMNDREKEDL